MVILLTGGIGWNAAPSEIVKTVTANTGSVTVRDYFTDPEWNSIASKRLVIPSGVAISSSQSWGAIRVQDPSISSGYGGILTIEVRGGIFGIGGPANSGQGGDAFYSGSYSASGIKPVVQNYGMIYSGGGGGGQGGAGSTSGTVREPASGFYFSGSPQTFWQWTQGSGGVNTIVWFGTVVYNQAGSSGVTQVSAGGYTYYRGDLQVSNVWGIARTGPGTIPTAGGSGGRGRGSDGAPASGSSGGAGAGSGGNGGEWGNSGDAGSAGNAGSGSAGGLSGVAYNSATVTMQNSGDIRGRVT